MIAQRDARAHVVNQLGSFIVALLDGRHSIAEIVGAMAAEFDVDPDTARVDLIEFLAVLDDLNLINRPEDKDRS